MITLTYPAADFADCIVVNTVRTQPYVSCRVQLPQVILYTNNTSPVRFSKLSINVNVT